MPEQTQIIWTHKELVTLMVKAAGLHEGRWWLQLNFGFAPGNFGPSDEEMSPGVVVVVGKIGLQREGPEGKAASGLVVDAAEVNPLPAKPGSSKRRPKE